jgi:hypothetical protein
LSARPSATIGPTSPNVPTVRSEIRRTIAIRY